MNISHDDSIPPSPASTVSSTLQQFAAKLNGTHSSSIIETPGNGQLYYYIVHVLHII